MSETDSQDAPVQQTRSEDDILQRLAVVEARTDPRKRSFLEQLQSYGGMIALAIAVLYSWPLGIWDRFFVTVQEEKEQALQKIRTSLTRATGLSVEVGKVQSSIGNPEFRDIALRSLRNQVLLTITSHDSLYEKFRTDLFPEELLMIGIMHQDLYRIEDSLRYFKYAAERDDLEGATEVEVSRQLAKSYFVPSPHQNQPLARRMYQKTIVSTRDSPNIAVQLMSILIQSEWGFLEMASGDWLCGTENMKNALGRLAQKQPLINDQGNYQRLLRSKIATLTRTPNQPTKGCGQ